MATNEGNTALRRNKNTPLEAHQTDDFPEGLNYMKMPFFGPKTSEKMASCTEIQEAGVGKMETIWTIWKHWTEKAYMVVQIFQIVSCIILVRRFLAILGVAGLLKIVSF